jgi:SAM-dependent MidA family methyltransferase
VDRSLERIDGGEATYVRTIDELPKDGAHLFFSNELYDALPFARLVQRGEHVHELWVKEREGVLDWTEYEAPAAYDDYFAERGIGLAEGQFGDVSLEWEAFHADVAKFLQRGLIVTIDYGYPADKLFHPRARRFGTAAAYAGQRVARSAAGPASRTSRAHQLHDPECGIVRRNDVLRSSMKFLLSSASPSTALPSRTR